MTPLQCRLLLIAILIGVSPGAGCLGEPIPKRVVAGTSFALPFSEGVFGVAPGLRSGMLLSTDPQRGNIRFALCTTSMCTTQTNLLVRYTTRVFPDPGSPFGLTGTTEVQFGSDPPIVDASSITGEPVVVLDVPGTMAGGTYMLAAFLDPPGSDPERMISMQQQIKVVAKPSPSDPDEFTDIAHLVNAGTGDASNTLRAFIPHPQLELKLSDVEDMNDRPAAGSLELQYPLSVQIKGVFESGVLGQNSMVRFKDDTVNRRVAIQFVDPEKRTIRLKVAFALTDPNPPVTLNSFTISSPQRLYSLTGALLPDTDVPANAGNRFLKFRIQ